nr:glycine cleavage T C-terminal barrel domain-containing protein [Pseudoclavibacter sp. 13-3]
MGEQHRLITGRAVLGIPTRDVVHVTGPDRERFLNVLLSRDVGSLAAGDSDEALLLDAAGHVQFAVGAVGGTADDIWLLPERGGADRVIEWVRRMRFMLRVEAEDATSRFTQIGWFAVAGRDWQPALEGLADFVWRDPWEHLVDGGWQYADDGAAEYETWTWRIAFVGGDRRVEAKTLLDDAEVRRSGGDAWQALRIAAARPREADEVDERTIPHELDWLRSAVHLSKGCYPGQETIAKVHNLGHPPRRLVLLQLDGSDTWVEHGDLVRDADQQVGTVTTGGMHWEMGPVALAVVRRGVALDAELTVQHGDETMVARQEAIVPADAGGLAASVVRDLRRARRRAR